MNNFLRFFRHYGLSICVGLTILYLCMMPSSNSSMNFNIPNIDKLVHALMYMALTSCICLNMYQDHTSFKSMTMVMWGLVIPILFGALIEVMQGELTIDRSCDFYDWVADSLGSLIGYGIASYLVPRFFKENDD